MKYCAGLIGAGYISVFHVAALRRAGIEIAGIYDVDGERASAAAKQFGVRLCASPAELAQCGANVMHVLTPPHTHTAVALAALNLGCHVLVEKPLAEDVEDCARIDRLAAEKGLQVCVNHSLLFDPHIRRALDAARSGKLGKIVSVDILRSSAYPAYPGGALPPQYRSAGYPFRDLGVHCLYLLEALLGPIQDVKASWASIGGEPNLAFDEWRAQVRCRDGIGQFQLSWNVRPMQNQLIIQGTRGVMRVDLFLLFRALRKPLPLPKAAERIVNALTDSVQPLIDVPRGVWGYLRKKVLPYHGLQDLVKAFYDSLQAGASTPVSVVDATRVVQWTEQIARRADAEHLARLATLPITNNSPILVTGASGALGTEIVRKLRDRGERFRILVRRPPAEIFEGMEIAIGDLGDPEAVDRAVRGAKIVIHAGAATRGGWLEHQCATVTGTQNVLQSCLKHGVRKLVHISSMSVIEWAGAKTNAVMDENSPLEPRAAERGSYTRAKLEAELLVSAFARDHKLPTVILRPGQIFGGKIRLLSPAVARRMGKRWLMLGRGDIRLPLVYIEDVADAILLAADSALGSGEVVQLVDSYNPTQRELLQIAEGKSTRAIRLPRPIVFSLGKFSELALGVLKRQSPLSVYRLRSGLARRTFRSLNAQTLLGWTPRIGARQAIARMFVSTEQASQTPIHASETTAQAQPTFGVPSVESRVGAA